MIAALYVEHYGVYFGLEDVDPWDERRDARLYDGPWPVVAHPPCKAWSIMGQCRPEIVRGDDDGCFEAALAAVRQFGGVLEHPRHTHAWKRFGLARPASQGWTSALDDDGFTCEVDQRHYGHRARKPTWLYAVGVDLPALTWGFGPRGTFGTQHKRAGTIASSHHGAGTDRSGTPLAFRNVLLDMARSAVEEAGNDSVEHGDDACQMCGWTKGTNPTSCFECVEFSEVAAVRQEKP